ncbi:MAG TPA: MFS transporter [Candidatus Thermoplasmatota archaeon]|nr:MFS transporter [Candidatus Thermoplasmatota archaeon]
MASQRLAVATVLVGSFLATLNIASVSIALPTLTDEFGVGVDGGKLVVVGYVATVTLLLIPFGRLGDMLGRRRFYAAGFLLFAVGATLCSVASGLWQLVAFRVLQAFGAAMLIAQGSALIAAVVPAGQRGQALGWQVVAVALGSTSGNVLGGFLTDALGWRSVFWTNAPVAALGVVLALRVLPRGLRTPGSFDARGAALLMLAIGLVVAAANVATPSAPWLGLPPLAAATVVLALFVRQQARSAGPLLAAPLRRSRVFLGGIFAALFGFTASVSGTFLAPFLLQKAMGLPPRLAGLAMLAYPVSVSLCSPLSGRLSDRIGGRVPATAGLLAIALGLVALGFLRPDSPVWLASLFLAILGVGIGLFASPNNNAVFHAAPREHLGVANGMLGTMRNLGVTLGASLASLVFVLSAPGHVQPADPDAFVAAMRPALWLGAGFAVVAALLSLARGAHRATETEPLSASETT